MMRQIADKHEEPAAGPDRKFRGDNVKGGGRESGVMLSSDSDQKPLTKREREVLNLISKGVLQQAGRLPGGYQSENLRKLSRRGYAKAWSAKHGGACP